ncbi:virion structural protein [Serratia phage BF]|uniref:Uncharacterized protein n=3 Tax=Eneladusvirus BF TaxID=2560751 RepID=A0A1S6UAR6_9CAUD|nr:virion structural protein [Serratia phage BF]QOI71204.1 putative structural protein [Erwinia phage pEa_SNUABM_12]QOI71748.1 putative structural protein [Erwinia phage pEa_SNUABM_47]QXO11961.1 hypothetical protein pEaSNUABM44_00265 [Erwinia phage pEa_SNUABM_44]QXO12514.1 hypothetical protein pEaSNUABM49_00268 [Erwinia phage pEa_SNUABM_49]AQW88792.1 hypothetical protein BF_0267 [Serratia phage BF]
MTKKIIPFWLYPSHWGLKGQAKELAEIDFYFEGVEADLKRADIMYLTDLEREHAKNEIKFKHNVFDELEYELNKVQIDFEKALIHKLTASQKKLDLQLKYGRIDEKTYDTESIELIQDEDKKYLAALEFSLKYGDITQSEYDKELKTHNREPWFEFNVDFDESENDLVVTFDYNEYFWKKLRSEGHPGTDEHEIIDNFIKDWGRKLATEDYNGDFDTKLTSLNDEMNQTTGTSETGFKVYE